jgi:DNA-binding transcriptional LysR family regulator
LVNKVELRDIEYFAVVAEHGHLGRAAEALGLSTPALSKSLRRLEKLAGSKLVKRTPRGVELTAAGEALFSQVGRLRLALSDVSRELADIGNGRSGLLRVGANQYSIAYLLPAVCQALMRDAPGLTLALIAGGNDILVPAIHSGRLDLAIGFMPSAPDGLVDEELLRDQFVVYASVGHRLAGRKRVSITDVAVERWALGPSGVPDSQWLHRAFESAGLSPPTIAMETSTTQLRLHAVAESDLLGFAPRQFVRQTASGLRLVELPIKDLAWPCRLAVRYRKDAYLPPIAKRFIELLKVECRGLPR